MDHVTLKNGKVYEISQWWHFEECRVNFWNVNTGRLVTSDKVKSEIIKAHFEMCLEEAIDIVETRNMSRLTEIAMSVVVDGEMQPDSEEFTTAEIDAAITAAQASVKAALATQREMPNVVIKTFGGMTLRAPLALVEVVPAFGDLPVRLAASWDMRHGLIHNQTYFSAVRMTEIKEITYVR